jgi:copper resistance protein C
MELSRTPPRHAGRRAYAAALASAAVVLAVLAGVAPAASAHDELIGTSPAAGSTVSAYPDEITLTFSGAVLGDGSATRVQVTDGGGSFDLADGAPVVQDATVVQRLTWPQADLAIREVRVLWRVVSQDGHPVSGEYRFRIEPGSAPTASPTVGTTASAAVAPPTADATTAPPANGGGAASSAAPWIILGALTIAAMAATAYLVVARGRRAQGGGGDGPPDSGSGSGR